MKQLELSLQKKLLIVEVDDDISTAQNIKIEQGILKYDVEKYLDGKTDVWICNKKELSGNIKLICKGSEWTEEIAKEYVEGMYSDFYLSQTNISQLYKSSVATYVGYALNAFKERLKKEVYYWGENPLGDEDGTDGEGYVEDEIIHKEWQEAESKTFNLEKTIICEIV